MGDKLIGPTATVTDARHGTATAAHPTMQKALRPAPGLALALVLGLVATLIGRAVPVLGGPVVGVILGVALSPFAHARPRLSPGIRLVSTRLLQLAVVLLGAQWPLQQVIRAGARSLPVMLGTLAACLVATYAVGRVLRVPDDLGTLIGVGTGICGASAIAAVSPVIRARSSSIAYAVSTIFVFNIAAVLCFPALGHALHLSQHDFGLFAGTAVNDTSSVVAAATSYGNSAVNTAVVVKLTRVLMLIPISLGLVLLTRRRQLSYGADTRAAHSRITPARFLPWFLVGFLLLAGANSAGLVPAATRPSIATAATFLITMALAAIGLSTNFASLRRTGPRPLLLGFVLWLAVASTSLGLQALTGAL